MVEPAVAVPAPTLETLVMLRSALGLTGTTSVVVLFPGVGSGVVLVPAALLLPFPGEAVPGSLPTSVSVGPGVRLVATAGAPEPASVTVPLPPVLLLEM